MIRVKNQKVIANLSRKSLKANRVRNAVAVFAIALTTLLFTALFTIAGTILNSFQQETFRQVGGDMHGTFKNLTLEEKEMLEEDSLIVKSGSRLMLGMGAGDKFRKVHAEFSYMDADCAKGYFCTPEHGRLPKENTKEIACDSRILQCLGIEPEIGAEIELTYNIDDGGRNQKEKTDTFTLVGWWEYDPANMASMGILPKSYVDEIAAEYPRVNDMGTIGRWDLNVYLKSSMHIESDLKEILSHYGFQSDDAQKENYISIGVNWAYAGAQMSDSMDAETILAVAVLLILIILTGYLIIYNIFQISVSGDIRFYGLLKTIGTTGKQLRQMIRREALLLSVSGIPIGLILGYLAGAVLAPVVMSTLSVEKTYLTMNPWIFVGAAVFSLVTVLLSCAKPGRIAAKVSPVEAVRYTDAEAGKKQHKNGKSGGKIGKMAMANLGRNKKKTVLVVLSLSLAVVLLQATYMFARGFDMDKYLRSWVVSDFIVGDAGYFQTGSGFDISEGTAVQEETIQAIGDAGEITEGGRIYGQSGSAMEFITEEQYRKERESWLSKEEIDSMLQWEDRDEKGNVGDRVRLYGMEDYPLSQLEVIEGDLSDVFDPDKNAIAAVYLQDDYGNPEEDSQWAKVGDTVSVRYVDAWEYRDDKTGEIIPEEKIDNYEGEYTATAKKYRDVEYQVAACVMMNYAMSYRYFGSYEFVLNADVFRRDSGTSDVMTYLFNTTEESNDAMEDFLKNYTENINPLLDYESKQSYVDEFNGFRNMFLLLGGALSFVIGVVGVLNFFNAVLTSIFSRKREFAMLQSIGMTGAQLKRMLMCEGLFYAFFAIVLSLVLSLAMGPVMANVVGSMFWFFTYRFTILPVVVVVPVFVILGIVLPLLSYRKVSRQTIVERLRESE